MEMGGLMKRLIPLLWLLAASALAQPASTDNAPGRSTLLGTIGQSYLVRMELERTGDQIKGRYHYERPGVVRPGGGDLSLAGRIDAAGNVELIETSDVEGREVRTGEFKGVLRRVTIDGQPVSRLDGTWTRTRDGRQLPFTLESIRVVFGDVSLTSREERDENRALNYTLRLQLPALGDKDSKFNRHLAAIVNPLVAGFKKDVAELRRAEQGQRSEVPPSSFEVDYAIVQTTPELLSLQLSIYSFTGGAHPTAQTRSLNWNPRLDRALVLADLFKPGTAYGQAIADYCRRELARLDLGDSDWLTRGTTFNDENYQRWNTTRAGLRLTFDQYQVAAYAQGSFEVTVPWGRLKTYLR
jgi:hypothetical protein